MENSDKMPRAVWFIIPNELGERFCYYGLTPVLKNFLKVLPTTHLCWSRHLDSYLDKFKTITILSSVYVFGFLLLTITSWPTIMGVETTMLSRTGPLIGLFLIALGTGVSSHAYLPTEKYGLQKFYNYFYISINVGSLLASYVSPAIQKKEFFTFPNATLAIWKEADVHPTGNGYPYVFLMLTCFMTCALGVFVAGYKSYRIVPPAGKFILIDIFTVAYTYIKNRMSLPKQEAYEKTCNTYTEGMVVEMMDLAKVIGAIWPAPIFWMAFNQNGSTWQDLGDQMAVPFGQSKADSFLDSATVNNISNPIFIVLLLQSLPTGCSRH
ncbi:hypothetical protein BCR33DRAFT_770664 [Rhizoclosmatium globosum]|uniref:PTR2-domain-containing protein n=1 Tax=Rhizoclosmatium globosum TaxID=329046 RepID=A0A1Y2BKA7_9FUNG|nr:hypothetical protein BCR33DRAFT_770664 [Rhizoclosmatium globosum]|eukprot:ORY35201.1 hypothetical protein BCR33DRAFT_770664 [Rhizoclosmatium globosum]